jgi:hypothetical protein
MADTTNSLDFDCNWKLGFNLHGRVKGAIGYLLFWSGCGGLNLTKDISVWNPYGDTQGQTVTSGLSINCIGLISAFRYPGGSDDPIRITCYVSKDTAANLRAKLASPLTSTKVKVQWYIVAFDDDQKNWFEAAFVQDQAKADAVVDTTRGQVQMFISNEPTAISETLDIKVYKFEFQIVPATSSSTNLEFATGSSQHLVKAWGSEDDDGLPAARPPRPPPGPEGVQLASGRGAKAPGAPSGRAGQADHPLDAEAVLAHTEVRPPGRVGEGHGDAPAGAERGEDPVGFGLVARHDGDMKVVAVHDGRAEALDRVAGHQVDGLGEGELAVHDLPLHPLGHARHEARLAEGLHHHDARAEDRLVEMERLGRVTREIHIDMSELHAGRVTSQEAARAKKCSTGCPWHRGDAAARSSRRGRGVPLSARRSTLAP